MSDRLGELRAQDEQTLCEMYGEELGADIAKRYPYDAGVAAGLSRIACPPSMLLSGEDQPSSEPAATTLAELTTTSVETSVVFVGEPLEGASNTRSRMLRPLSWLLGRVLRRRALPLLLENTGPAKYL